jgi:hypothetical protein
MNAVLQCLTHTPPLAEALLSPAGAALAAREPRARAAPPGARPPAGPPFDALRATQAHIVKALAAAGGGRRATVAPLAHARALKAVCRRCDEEERGGWWRPSSFHAPCPLRG